MSPALKELESLVLELDERGRFLNLWTRRQELLAARDALVGRRASELVGPGRARPLVRAARRAVLEGRASDFEWVLASAGGRMRFRASVSPMPSDSGGRTALLRARALAAGERLPRAADAGRPS